MAMRWRCPARKRGGIGACLVCQADAGKEPHGVLFCISADGLRVCLYGKQRALFVFFAEQVGKARAEVPAPGAAQILHSHMDGSKGDVFEHVHVVEQVELLEHHAHAAALDVDVDFQVAEVVPFKKDVAVRRVFQNVETAQESAFAAARRSDDGDLFAPWRIFSEISSSTTRSP